MTSSGQNHQLNIICWTTPASAGFDHPASICIKAELINEDIFAEYHLLDYICIIGPNHISVNRVINLDINIKAERFIRTICPSHISLFINDHRVETCSSQSQ